MTLTTTPTKKTYAITTTDNNTKIIMNYDALILSTFIPALFFLYKSMTNKEIDLFEDVSKKKNNLK